MRRPTLCVLRSRSCLRFVACFLVACCLAAACARKRPALPSGPGTPFPEFASAYAEATDQCRGVNTLSAAIGLTGRAGKTKLRGRIDAGFAAPADMRLEGVHPFGKPVFILVARGDDATLLLPRDGRVLRGARPGAIVEALTGVALGPAELRAVIAGCGFGPDVPTGGRAYEKKWAALDAGDTTVYLRQLAGRWRVAAAARGTLSVAYENYISGRPETVRMRMMPERANVAADLTLRLSQVDTNVPMDRKVFEVDIPDNAVPLTIEELRRAGPLGAAGEPSKR
jgi:outer membrane lipoprotein-sorting protein